MTQIAFDLDRLILEDDLAANPWTGAPLRFTTDYYDPAELVDAFERYCLENGSFGCIPRSKMWHLDFGHRTLQEPLVSAHGHTLHMFSADTRCWHTDHERDQCQCVGELIHQAICQECRWHHIAESDTTAAAAWHDHAMPGWRDLPIISGFAVTDSRGRPTRRALDWIDEHYPAHWIFPGAPTIRPRTEHGNRAVERRSPLGGYDFAADT